MKLAEWARQPGLDYTTAYRWFRAGIPPVPSKQLPRGTILVEPVPLAEKRGALVVEHRDRLARLGSESIEAGAIDRPEGCR